MSAAGRRPNAIYDGYVFDLDGTLYVGEEPIQGAAEVIAGLRAAGARVAFLTNNPLELPIDYARKLRRLNIPVADDEVVSSTDALVRYLEEHAPDARIFAIAEPLLISVLTSANFRMTADPDRTDVVVVSFDRSFHYDKLRTAFLAVRAGARIVATNPDPYCPSPDGGLPDCGAILAALEVATGIRAEAVVGKPSALMAAAVLDHLGTEPSKTLLVGDRLETDIRMARKAGMRAALVMTGVTTVADLAATDERPDLILQSVADLLLAVAVEEVALLPAKESKKPKARAARAGLPFADDET